MSHLEGTANEQLMWHTAYNDGNNSEEEENSFHWEQQEFGKECDTRLTKKTKKIVKRREKQVREKRNTKKIVSRREKQFREKKTKKIVKIREKQFSENRNTKKIVERRETI